MGETIMHSLLDRYLEQVSAQLKPLPIARRDEELREMRQHLLNATNVNQEAGQSEGDAAANAVKQFGTPEGVGEAIVLVWLREHQKQNRRRFWLSVACMPVLVGIFWESARLSHQSEGYFVFISAYFLMVSHWAYLTPKNRKSNGTYGVPPMGLARCLLLTVLAPACWVVDTGHEQYTPALAFWSALSAISQAVLYVGVLFMLWYPRHAMRLSESKTNGSSGVG